MTVYVVTDSVFDFPNVPLYEPQFNLHQIHVIRFSVCSNKRFLNETYDTEYLYICFLVFSCSIVKVYFKCTFYITFFIERRISKSFSKESFKDL